ncbi:TPA: NUDIX domain-containing protein [Candidatus Micrarchaeota archaeon]|nr:NUDIX domain-containing protein [Candidatus Micrarchaeota archaeon]
MKHHKNEVEVATGAFIIRNREILLVSGPKFHGKWTVPGGHVEFGETSKACVERKVKEELNVEGKATEMFSSQEATKHNICGRERHFVFLNWKCKINGEPKPDGVELTECVWMPLEEALDNTDVMDSIKEGIKRLAGEEKK